MVLVGYRSQARESALKSKPAQWPWLANDSVTLGRNSSQPTNMSGYAIAKEVHFWQ